MQKKKIAQILGYLGLIPFYLLIILFFYTEFNQSVIELYFFYNIIILSFLCGSLWSKTLNTQETNPRTFFLILSVTIPIIAIALDFYENLNIKIIFYIVFYFMTGIMDKQIFTEKNNDWYLILRKRLNFFVILSQLIYLISINAHSFI